jgi:hypothetical protein
MLRCIICHLESSTSKCDGFVSSSHSNTIHSKIGIIQHNFFHGSTNMETLLHIVPFCEGPNKKSEGFAKEKQITWRVCEGKKICQLCDAECIATCGAPLIANLEWTFNHRRTFARYTTNKTLRSAQSLSTVTIFHPSQRLIILKTSQPLQYT